MQSVHRKYPTVNVAGAIIPLVPRSELPPTIPEQVNGTATQFFNFPAQRGCYALDLVIDNLDAVNNLTFRINNPQGSGTIKTLVAGGAFTFGDQIICTVEILTGSTNWEMTFSQVPLEGGRYDPIQ